MADSDRQVRPEAAVREAGGSTAADAAAPNPKPAGGAGVVTGVFAQRAPLRRVHWATGGFCLVEGTDEGELRTHFIAHD